MNRPADMGAAGQCGRLAGTGLAVTLGQGNCPGSSPRDRPLTGLSARNWVPQALAKAVRAAKIWHLPHAAAAGLRRVWYVTAIACPAESGAFVVQAEPRRYTAATFRGPIRVGRTGNER